MAARLFFDEVLCLLVPLTLWWSAKWWSAPAGRRRSESRTAEEATKRLTNILDPARFRVATVQAGGAASKPEPDNYTPLERYAALAGLILWIGRQAREENSADAAHAAPDNR